MRDNLSQRPKINTARTGFDYFGEFLAGTGIVAGLLLLAVAWGEIPEQVPRHFGIDGQPTAWDGRWSVVAPIVIAFVLYVVLTLLNRIPHYFNYPWAITEENAAIQYQLSKSMLTWLKAVIVWTFVLIVWGQIRVATGHEDGLPLAFIPGFVIGVHLVIGVFIYRGYRSRNGNRSSSRPEPD